MQKTAKNVSWLTEKYVKLRAFLRFCVLDVESEVDLLALELRDLRKQKEKLWHATFELGHLLRERSPEEALQAAIMEIGVMQADVLAKYGRIERKVESLKGKSK